MRPRYIWGKSDPITGLERDLPAVVTALWHHLASNIAHPHTNTTPSETHGRGNDFNQILAKPRPPRLEKPQRAFFVPSARISATIERDGIVTVAGPGNEPEGRPERRDDVPTRSALPPSVPSRDHQPCRLAVPRVQPQSARCRADPGGTRCRRLLRDGAIAGHPSG